MTRTLYSPHCAAARPSWRSFRASLFSSQPSKPLGKSKKYIPEIANQSGVSESELFYAFDRFPIISIPSVAYDERRKQAENLIAHRDPKDVEILALALKFNAPLWTNDKDFENLQEVQILTTADMLEKAVTPAD